MSREELKGRLRLGWFFVWFYAKRPHRLWTHFHVWDFTTVLRWETCHLCYQLILPGDYAAECNNGCPRKAHQGCMRQAGIL